MDVTLKQIAQRVGVSQPLVTYALNGKPGVSEAMRTRILDTAREMGYSPHANRAAKELIAKRHGTRATTGLLALLMPPVDGQAGSIAEHPFFLPYFSGVEIESARLGYNLLVCAMRNGEFPHIIETGGVDGVIGVSVPDAFEMLRTRGIPALSLGYQEEDAVSLVADDEGGIGSAVAHLAGLGHRRIAYLGFNEECFVTARLRANAFRKAVRSCGLVGGEEFIVAHVSTMNEHSGGESLDALLARQTAFSAIVCYNDQYAMGALDRLQHLGLRVPQDVAVVGFDGYATQIGFRPLLTSATYDRQEMARRAVHLLRGLFDGSDTGPRVENFPLQLVRGETS